MKKYIVESGWSIKRIEDVVAKRIENGYILIGGIQVRDDSGVPIFYQSLILPEVLQCTINSENKEDYPKLNDEYYKKEVEELRDIAKQFYLMTNVFDNYIFTGISDSGQVLPADDEEVFRSRSYAKDVLNFLANSNPKYSKRQIELAIQNFEED